MGEWVGADWIDPRYAYEEALSTLTYPVEVLRADQLLRAELVAALERYGGHSLACRASWMSTEEGPCDCGWDAIEAGLRREGEHE